MEMAHFHPGEFLVKKTLQFKKEEALLHNDRMEAVSNGLVLLQWSRSHCKRLLLCVTEEGGRAANRIFLFPFFKKSWITITIFF